MNTTLEIPEGSKAVISGKVIDGKNYLVVEVENEEQKEPEWTKFKKGDFVVLDERWISIYKGRGTSETCISDYCGCWIKNEYYNILGVRDGLDYRNVDWSIRLATEEEKQDLLDKLAKKGLMWDAEKLELVKIPDVPEWKNFKRGDVLKGNSGVMVLFDKFYYEYSMERHELEIAFRSLINNKGTGNDGWRVDAFAPASDKEKAKFFKLLRDEKGLEWDGEKLVEVLKAGDFAIFWNDNTEDAIISVCKRLDDNGRYVDHLGLCWDNALKWDGTKEQYEKVLRGEI